MWKKIVLAIVVVLIGLVGYVTLNRDNANAQVAEDIRANPDGERARRTMLLTLADGRMYPVNYLVEDNLVFMGIDGRWWREFTEDGAPVEMYIRGNTLTGHGRVVLDDQAYVDDVFARLRPTAPAWLPAWLNGKLVVITLDEGT